MEHTPVLFIWQTKEDIFPECIIEYECLLWYIGHLTMYIVCAPHTPRLA